MAETNPNVDFCSTKSSNCCNSFMNACIILPCMYIFCLPCMYYNQCCDEDPVETNTFCYSCDLFNKNLFKCLCHTCDQKQVNAANNK